MTAPDPDDPTNAGGNRDDRGALQRLQNLQLPQAVMDQLQRTREPVISFDWPSPVSGVVMQKKAIEGMMMKAGDEMLRLADLSSIWVIADVAKIVSPSGLDRATISAAGMPLPPPLLSTTTG